LDITINTPALLFPAISLIMLAYTNRFVALSSVVRNLHDRYKATDASPVLHAQIRNLRYRLKLIRRMQFLGVMSFLFAIVCMYLIYIEDMQLAGIVFAISVILLSISLIYSLIEIQISTRSLELELSDVEGLDMPNLIDYLKKRFDKD
jgi:hypothetical protein